MSNDNLVKVKFNLANKLKVNVDELKILNSSRDNMVFVVRNHNKLIARVSLNKSFRDVSEEVFLLRYLYNNAFPVPAIKDLFEINNEGAELPVVVFEHTDHISIKRLSINHVSSMASKLADLHNVTLYFCEEHDYVHERNLIVSAERLIKYLYNLVNISKPLQELCDSLKWAVSFYNAESIKNRPEIILHNDYRQNNVLFGKNSSINAIIDFDWSLKCSIPEKDIAHAAMELSMHDGDAKCDMSMFNHLVDEYAGSAKLEVDLSSKYLYNWARFSAITDAAYYFLSFPDRLRPIPKSYMYDKYNYFSSLN